MSTILFLFALLVPQIEIQATPQSSVQDTDKSDDQPPDSSPFKGDGVSSSSRSCNGFLRIYPRYIDWELTDFSCHHVVYETLKQSPREYIYRLKPWSRRCGFRILIVQHPDENGGINTPDDKAEGGWYAIGYQTESGWHKHDSAQELGCPAMY